MTALLGASLVVATGYVKGWLGKHEGPVRTCPPTGPVKASQVTLNVYNATGRAGLARTTADELRKRGFKIATVTNDPLEKKVTGTSEVRYGATGARAARLVAVQVKGARLVRDSRSDGSVDIVIGNRFTALAAPVKTNTKTNTKTKTKTKTKTGSKAAPSAPSGKC